MSRSIPFIVNTIKRNGIRMVSVCDLELLGTTVEGGGLQMHISKEYFGGEPMSWESVLALLKNSTMANLVGTRIVSEVISANLADRRAVKRIGSVSFLMIYNFAR